MGTDISEKRNKVSAARRALELAEAELANARPAEPATGTIVLITGGFREGQQTYSYAAVNAAGLWYVTGARTPDYGLTWDDLVDWFTNHLRANLKFAVTTATKQL